MTNTAVIVDDDILIAIYLEYLLTDIGWKVCDIAATSADAVAKVVKYRPHLVLMDVCLRGREDGIETAKLIHHQYQCPIIFITGNTDPDTASRIHDGSPVAVLSKPVIPHQLYQAIETAGLTRSL